MTNSKSEKPMIKAMMEATRGPWPYLLLLLGSIANLLYSFSPRGSNLALIFIVVSTIANATLIIFIIWKAKSIQKFSGSYE